MMMIKILKVCREFVRGACKRAESECRFAHPKEGVIQLDDGSVTVCMDAIKGRCSRSPCRYFHPPLHLQAQIKAAQSRAVIVEFFITTGYFQILLLFFFCCISAAICCRFLSLSLLFIYFSFIEFISSSILQFSLFLSLLRHSLYLRMLYRTYSHAN